MVSTIMGWAGSRKSSSLDAIQRRRALLDLRERGRELVELGALGMEDCTEEVEESNAGIPRSLSRDGSR
jgi:hypothetical protein